MKLRFILAYLRGFFPSKLPTRGISEFDLFVSDIFELYDLPSLPSYRHAIASMIMHLGPQTSHKSKFFFAAAVKKAMANQIAYEVIQEIKQAEADKMKAESASLSPHEEKEESPFQRTADKKTGRSH